jgi:hypothetical protein
MLGRWNVGTRMQTGNKYSITVLFYWYTGTEREFLVEYSATVLKRTATVHGSDSTEVLQYAVTLFLSNHIRFTTHNETDPNDMASVSTRSASKCWKVPGTVGY